MIAALAMRRLDRFVGFVGYRLFCGVAGAQTDQTFLVLPAFFRIAFAVWRLFRLCGTSKNLPVFRHFPFSWEPFAFFQYSKPSLGISLVTML